MNITENGSHDVNSYESVNVNISHLTQYTSGSITISSDIAGVQTDYDSSKLKITVGFVPKIFIFRPSTYNTSVTLGKYNSSYSIISSSVNVYEGLTSEDMGAKFSTFITKLTASSEYLSTAVSISGGSAAISVGNTGFNINSNNPTEVWWYISDASYKIRAGTWFWEAYA